MHLKLPILKVSNFDQTLSLPEAHDLEVEDGRLEGHMVRCTIPNAIVTMRLSACRPLVTHAKFALQKSESLDGPGVAELAGHDEAIDHLLADWGMEGPESAEAVVLPFPQTVRKRPAE